MDFPVNRDGWSGQGRTKARWLKDTLDTPYSKARVGSGGKSATAYHKNGFLEVKVKSAADTDYYMALTRDTFATDEIRAARKIATKWSGGQRVYWTQTSSIAHPLADDLVARRYRSGLYSMGGNGYVFCLVPISKESVTDRWGREVTYEVAPVFGGGTRTESSPSVRRNIALMVGRAGGDFAQAGPTFPVDSFSETAFTNRAEAFVGCGAFSAGDYVEWLDTEAPAPPAVVEGAYYNGSFEAAVAFNAIDQVGDRVVRVRVFKTDGSYIERTIAGAPFEAFSLRGFWRCGPGDYVACISHMYQAWYGKVRSPQRDYEVGTSGWHGSAPLFRFREQVMLPQSALPMNYFVVSRDGGRTWSALPENDLLRGANQAAAAAAVEDGVWGQWGVYSTGAPLCVMSYAIRRSSAVPVAPGKLFVMLLDSYTGAQSSRGVYRNSRIIRGVLDIATGAVTAMATVYDMPALDDVGYAVWRNLEPGYMFGGACALPAGVGYLTLPASTTYGGYLSAFPLLHRSFDAGATFATDAQTLPARWYVSRSPQTLSGGLYQVALDTDPYSSVYRYAAGQWTPAATLTAPWRGDVTGTLGVLSSSAYIYAVSGVNTNDTHLYNRLVQPFRNPTSGSRWVSDDRITP